jgi:putative membrane protein
MSYLVSNWSFDPFLIVAAVVAVWHEIGLRRLAQRSPDRARQRRLRSLWFYAGLVVLLIAVESPIDYWANDYFFVHMLQHLLLMFAAPSLIVAGAPGQPLLEALPARGWSRPSRGWSRPLRAAGGFALRPWVSIGLFNLVMIVWHLPGPYDFAETNPAVRVWLMHGSFLAAGLLFWLQYIPSPPFRRRMPLLSQAGGLLLTNLIMIGLAMALSIFEQQSIYSVYAHVPGVTLPPLADQQIGAAILWVCGDFWAVPAMIAIVRQIIETEGGVGVALERMLSRGSARASGTSGGWAARGGGALAELRVQRPVDREPGDGAVQR